MGNIWLLGILLFNSVNQLVLNFNGLLFGAEHIVYGGFTDCICCYNCVNEASCELKAKQKLKQAKS